MEERWFNNLPEGVRGPYIKGLYHFVQGAGTDSNALLELQANIKSQNELEQLIRKSMEIEFKSKIDNLINESKLNEQSLKREYEVRIEEYKSKVNSLDKDREISEVKIRKEYDSRIDSLRSKIDNLENERKLFEMATKETIKTEYELKIKEKESLLSEYKNQIIINNESNKTEKEALIKQHNTDISYYKEKVCNIEEITENRVKKNYEEQIKNLNETINDLRGQNHYKDGKYDTIINDTTGYLKRIENTVISAIPSSTKDKGIQGEEFIRNILYQYFPYAKVISISEKSAKDGYAGDLMITINDLRIMIESKNMTNISLKKNPTDTIDKFKKELAEAKRKNMVDCGIFVSCKTDNIRGKVIYCEAINTENGKIGVTFLSDIYRQPERLANAIFMFMAFRTEEDIKTLQEILPNIERLGANNERFYTLIQQQENTINEMRMIYKYNNSEINSIIQNNTPDIETVVFGIYKAMRETDNKVSMGQLKENCIKAGIELPKNITKKYLETLYENGK
jgi:hypothetical protein